MSMTQIVVERWQQKHGAEVVEKLTLPGDCRRDRFATAALVVVLTVCVGGLLLLVSP